MRRRQRQMCIRDRYYNVYAFDEPLFYQTSSNGTDQPLTSYPTFEVIQPDRNFWKPTVLY